MTFVLVPRTVISGQRPLMLCLKSAGAILPVLGLQVLTMLLPSTSAPVVPSAPGTSPGF